MSHVRSARPDHCTGERYASFQDASPVLRLLNAPKRGKWTAIACPICRGWHLVDPNKTETTNAR